MGQEHLGAEWGAGAIVGVFALGQSPGIFQDLWHGLETAVRLLYLPDTHAGHKETLELSAQDPLHAEAKGRFCPYNWNSRALWPGRAP